MRKRNFFKIFTLGLTLAFTTPTIIPVVNQAITVDVEASEIELDKTKLTLQEGNSKKLTLKGVKDAEIKWSSSNKKIATVNKNGKVTAKSAGKAKITATLNNKTYTCTVTVKAKSKVSIQFSNYTFEFPTSYSYVLNEDYASMEIYSFVAYPSINTGSDKTSSIALVLQPLDDSMLDDDVMEYFEQIFTQEYVESQLASTLSEFTIKKFKTTIEENVLGEAFITEYKIKSTIGNISQKIYNIIADDKLIQITLTTLADEKSSILPQDVADMILKTIKTK